MLCESRDWPRGAATWLFEGPKHFRGPPQDVPVVSAAAEEPDEPPRDAVAALDQSHAFRVLVMFLIGAMRLPMPIHARWQQSERRSSAVEQKEEV
mmetsp:Transcript_12599/g.33840  ORF Transcript_12599/g.33840 Transcript_12599/m.33840 type:complete len:95 (-) Transcript_12599:3092-3376(-)